MKNYDKKVIDDYGDIYYYLNDKRHRTDGPAIEYVSGSKDWYLNGYFHDEKGPSTIYSSGFKFWDIEDKIQTLSNTTITLKPQIFQYNINEKLR
jgi:hypothetical protein